MKKLDGNELRKRNGYRCKPEYASVEHLPAEILCKFERSGNAEGQRGGSYYEPTPEEAAIIADRLYCAGGIAEQIRNARERMTAEDRQEDYESQIHSLDNGMLRGRLALGNSRRAF